MHNGFLQEEHFSLPYADIAFSELRKTLEADDTESIFTLVPLIRFFATKLLSWPITLDFMKILPQQITFAHWGDLIPDKAVNCHLTWAEQPSSSIPLPACTVKISQGEKCIAQVELHFYQRQPRFKPQVQALPGRSQSEKLNAPLMMI